ncbi:L-fuculose phosphate aldolase [Caulifigura coniformis]|uniref:L-fuculose phosphate aldolase n=2 Tax=Caulifigura coniformis TaxID=2527983 RepID=A0A517SIB1_9PLAN|nr:L-fuculose phosphate aldolase [Caulifigura coniformis]
MTNTDYLHPRDQILETMDRIYRHRMTTTSGGNVSIRDGSGDVWITPARVDKGALRRDDIVQVRPEGTQSGLHRASSELPFHQAIYAARPDLSAIVHAHPAALVAFSMTRTVPETRLFPQSWSVCGEVGLATYALPGSAQLGANIAKEFAAGFNTVVLENHGVVVGGANLTEAFQRFEALEFAAQTAIRSTTLGSARPLSAARLEAVGRGRKELPETDPPAPTSEEKELRRTLCEFVRRGCQQRLLISTEGSFSVRLGESSFLITPAHRDRYRLSPEDLVRIDSGRRATGQTPSRATACHEAIYRKHPTVKAICFAHPIHATAFSVTGVPFASRTIPESYIVLRDVQRIPFGQPYDDVDAVASAVSPRQPSAILENDGVLIVGTSILDAFDRLEVLEATAEALIFSGRIGAAAPMSDSVIDELRAHFLPE